MVRVRKGAVAAAAGAHQYGVGRPAGADRIARSLRVLAEARQVGVVAAPHSPARTGLTAPV